jgi:hypothetical protein
MLNMAENTFTLKHASIDYILEDITKMTKLGLRPHKADKDKKRIGTLVKTPENIDGLISKINYRLKNININQPEEKVSCAKDTNIHIYPLNNITLFKISRVLPFILNPSIIMSDPSIIIPDPSISKWEQLPQPDREKDPLSDNAEYRYTSKNFGLSTKSGKINATTAFNALTAHIKSIIPTAENSDWIDKIGQMVYSYQPAKFANNPLLLVHMIQMLCDGIQYNIPWGTTFKDLRNSVFAFIAALKDLEMACYKYQTVP